MGGQLDARSTEGMGATFALCLPGILPAGHPRK